MVNRKHSEPGSLHEAGLEFFLIARVVTNSLVFSLVLAVLVVSVFSTLWFLLPRNRKLQAFLAD